MTTVRIGRSTTAPPRRVAAGIAVAALLGLLAAPQSRDAALALLAAAGLAAVMLAAVGVFTFVPAQARFGDGLEPAFSALPGAFAVTTPRGKILWRSERFAELGAGAIHRGHIAPPSAHSPQSAAVYRLFAAARRGAAHSERLEAGNPKTPAPILDVKPHRASPRSPQLFIWSAREEAAEHAGNTSALSAAPAALDGKPDDAASPIANETFTTLLMHSPLPMAQITLDGRLRNANAAFRAIVPQTDGIADNILEAFADAGPLRGYLSSLAKRRADGGNPFDRVLSFQIPAGKSAGETVRITAHPAGAATALIVLLDAADTAPMDEQTAQAQKMQAVGELAGGIAHDFNNLLTAIIGFSDLLLVRFRASDPAFKDLMNIKNNANRAAELVRHILAYSRRQTLRPAILTLTDVIEDFHSSMGRVLGEKVKAEIVHGRDLWFVKADESQIFQVIMNLAVNARDAMPDGGSIAIRTSNVTERDSAALADRGLDRGEYVMCEVRDAGTGIKPEHLSKIFDPFFSTKEVGKGTGLGLSTVYGIVKQTGGTILVDSEIGSGTSFRIYLPRYAESEEERRNMDAKPESVPGPADLTGSGTVLLVEDEDAVRSFASRALSTRGYTVLEAGSGVEALEVMEREAGRIDLVVSDVVMPEMDGPTLLRHLRKKNPDIKIVFMSGYAEEAFRKNLDEGDKFVFLPKPFTLKKLAETVKAAAG